jgi:6-phosphogluconolactonase
MTRIHIADSSEALTLDAAETFVRVTTTAVEDRGRCAVALAGGGTPQALYRALAHSPALRARVPWHGIEFFWGDERVVPPDHADSNYRMAYDTMLSAVPVTRQQIHRVGTELGDPAAAAREYEDDIRRSFDADVQVPRFDLILLGLGKDGHVASLFPGTTALRESGRLCVENWVPNLSAYRITMTFPLLNQARAVVFVVSGPEKASIVRQVLRRTSSTSDLPAQLVRPSGDIVWMLDRDAASGLRELGP